MVALAGEVNGQAAPEFIPSFQAEQQFLVSGMHPFGLAAGDIRGVQDNIPDGFPEVAVCGSAWDIVSSYDRRLPGEDGGWIDIYRNLGVTSGNWNGLSLFQTIIPAIDIGTDTAPREVVFADLTQADVLDLVISTAAPEPNSFAETWGVLVYRWNGSRYVFHSANLYTGSNPTVLPARGLVVADFDNDGLNDVALAVDISENYNTYGPPARNRVAVFKNTIVGNESGYLQLAAELGVNLPDAEPTGDLVVADFNRLTLGQPLIDIVTANIESDAVSLLHTTGSYNFNVNNQNSACSDWVFTDMATSKFTSGSSNWDIAGVGYGGDCNLYILHGSKTGTFSHNCATDVYPLYSGGCGVRSPIFHAVSSGNLNGGTKTDLAVAIPGDPGGVTWLLGKGNGTFQFDANISSYSTGIAGWMPLQILCADLDQDGFDDIITSNHEVNNPNNDPFTISVLLNAMNITP
ncbi:MAG: VCBS repeat-containing protein [Planctomycetota bacterium]|nr:VCBS repeat-containing protein [Planctomycetota bacterium]